MQILAVNDSPLTLTAIKGLLESEGYEVLTALNGLEAINVLEKEACQIVLLDWEMPVMDGIGFCQAVRNRFFARYIYIIFLTSHNDLEHELDALEAGADDFIVKTTESVPLLLTKLRAVRQLLSNEASGLMSKAVRTVCRFRSLSVEEHGPRVARYCFALLGEMEKTTKFRHVMTPTFRRHFYSVCSLYDIGYMGIPDVSALGRRRLTNEEYETYKKHTVIGAHFFEQLLSEFPSAAFLEMARDMAATHHERYDGSGYPVGLKGDSIPLAGRILFLADTYDALTASDRSIEPVSHDYAKWLISQGRNIHFDPDVVEAFIRTEKTFLELFVPPAMREREKPIEIDL